MLNHVGSDTVKFMVNHSSAQAMFWCHKHYIVSLQLKVKKDDFPLPKELAGALKARKNDIPMKTLLTICEGREGTELSDGDVLLFPEMIRYSRDKRCGFCGPILIKKFKEEAELRGLDTVSVTARELDNL
ncbi:putative thioredoxin-like ferredoxin [Helianthus annuus]|uniref:Thioredoxin-like ferredoxin n=1 Tax=Helianthus annuus TaxID=4232 RepID=A0A251V6U6_HELAN|nr:putative thioredoxin-like ferredoxin [Helianthus annuus]KAJ0592763.1 putative thioredoxin-like ferredoxin [Helianthus annuus]KAJ0600418.1 putative thioredoxin-like ferredoxin [Helianthus annuus]KAJ0607764.1 putative thioredoxin-like ferredoxin [Helianthus annuus]KAJ0767828.1 putative thioredoxin-like ferredoxin [Helianthus annuus]